MKSSGGVIVLPITLNNKGVTMHTRNEEVIMHTWKKGSMLRLPRIAGVFSFVTLAFVSTANVLAVDVVVPSAYDEAQGIYIGDVSSLTNALCNVEQGQTVRLSRGVYDLSPLLLEGVMSVHPTYGRSILVLDKSGVQLIGETGDPDDVILKVENANARVILIDKDAQVRDLTVTGGNADEGAGWNYRVGGAIGLAHESTVVSNCVFYGNRAGVRGGAVAGLNGLYGRVYDCVFRENNETPNDGIAASKSRFYRCTFTNNVYVGANNNYATVIVDNSHLFDCTIVDNAASYCGGVLKGSATDCVFVNNRVSNGNYGINWGNPGGAAARDAALTNCTFFGNVSYRLGGAIRGGIVVGCTVSSNRTLATDGEVSGGGIYGASIVADSVVVSNMSVRGGGIYGAAFVTNCIIAFNYAEKFGGAAADCIEIHDSKILHNASRGYVNLEYSGSGGIHGGRIYGCTFRDNCASSVDGAQYMERCDVADGRVHCLTNLNCVIHDLHNKDDYVWCKGNVAYPDGHVVSNMYAISGVHVMRNCLVTNLLWQKGEDNYVNTAMFSACSGSVVNCTIADNVNYHLCRRQQMEGDAAYPLSFVNCAIVRNRRSVDDSIDDTTTMESSLVCFSNCIWTIKGSRAATSDGFDDVGCVELGTWISPKFLMKGDAPYMPRWSSPLRKIGGLVQDWMYTATDLLGNPRLRDGAVDIGCYQALAPTNGFVVICR